MTTQGIYANMHQIESKVALTMDELISRFKLSNVADGKSEKTIEWYDDILRLSLRYLETKYPRPDISHFNADNARAYILYLRARKKFEGHPHTLVRSDGLSPRTIQDHVRVLKVFSSWLYSEHYTEENRLKNLKLPKAPETIVEPLTSEETKTIIGNIREDSPCGPRNRTIVELINDAGLRAQEVANIKLAHLNLDKGYVKVMGKGSKERIVPIGWVVQRSLLRYVTIYRPKPKSNDCDNLFLSTTGCPITVNTIKLLFSRLAKTSGVARLHAHLCRHTFAVNYLLNGGDIFSLKAILGHTTLQMVGHYLHFTTAQVAAQHHKYSPMDKLYSVEGKVDDKVLSALASSK